MTAEIIPFPVKPRPPAVACQHVQKCAAPLTCAKFKRCIIAPVLDD